MAHRLAFTIALVLVLLAAVAVSWMRWHRLGPFRPSPRERQAHIARAIQMYVEEWGSDPDTADPLPGR